MQPQLRPTSTCIAAFYIDLNMVRAGVVRHPGEWGHSGYLRFRSRPSATRSDRSRGTSGVVRLYRSDEIFKEHTANGSSKRWKTAVPPRGPLV